MVIAVEPLTHVCSPDSSNLTSNGPYQKNLKKLIGKLYYGARRDGFGMESVGQLENQTFGLSLCRGDVSCSDCAACVVNASAEIRQLCPNNESATIWYDQCLLKYSNSMFIGQIDYASRFMMVSFNNVSNPRSFSLGIKRLLNVIAYTDPKMFSAGMINVGGSQKLYGLVQCTRDLSTTDCKTCLDDAMRQLPGCCNGKDGGRVVSASCGFRYETYSLTSV
ncbi:receptor-like protein kinase-related family protein [Artemisia annua]|uniref:Receptor-like protein kinase-related family protein n=1 Tax=Artemisia annua TaxID=35608 RepID=A0A2U1Q622_ARTAN|nr:receptor-like protein kinase-related family protein [Artemisia annua]